jgi:transposase-like protein
LRNLTQLSTQEKRDVVKEYLLEHPERVQEDTQEAIAQDLGVADDTVRRAREQLEDEGMLNFSGENFTTQEKRDLVQSYHEENPRALSGGTEIFDMARSHQEGRVPENGTSVPTHNFTEGWFLMKQKRV